MRNTVNSYPMGRIRYQRAGKLVLATYVKKWTNVFGGIKLTGNEQGANVGEIIGLFINGWASERFGYRYTVMACLALITGFTAILFTAQSVISLQVGEILLGIVRHPS